MIPNTQFPLNPGTNQQVNNWVDHSAQQVMHPLGQPVAQPLVPGQPPAVIPPPPGTPPPPPVPGNEHLSALDTPGTRPYIRANPTPETMPFYNADLPDQGKSLFYDAVNAWQAGRPGGPGSGYTPGMTRDERGQVRSDWQGTHDAYLASKPQWVVYPDRGNHGKPKSSLSDPNRWPGAYGGGGSSNAGY
jgi:hypothetical protein